MTGELTNQRQTATRCTKISKYLSKHLRHQPERLGLELLPGGWVEVDRLLLAAAKGGFEISRQELEIVVQTNDKQRFSFDISGKLIRANQGHSTTVDLQLPIQSPPAILYHGTHIDAVEFILVEGLQKMSRHHVHLTTNLTAAHQVGGRRGQSVVLAINASAMEQDGENFYRTDNDVWLVEAVAPKYLQPLKS